ncbi:MULTISPECIES: glycine--tRNA ligase subunit beta [Virgibacillus]|uniref:Glycine--tRNA ligase beta subunit n=1 Tax=Virgibacillus massiliensis TaxID=1462526 RepID=A0A024QAR9_9BACI|nr:MULTISPECIES: glycine--tRNA ligase subunit beta [Virgibacillus]EQB35936.1 hypothetical protein M948_12920 [Virgibacillus sp. CM-4]CDQ39628.1 Glycine--tRNA ligase beta subunit [Virgibacillus massiliensis]
MTKNALFEIGLEELPARFIDDAESQLKEKTEAWLHDLRISYEQIRSFSTPRRLAVMIKGVAEEQTTIAEEVKGPSLKIAKGEDGNWTKAAIGFSKGQGKTTDDLYIKELNGTSYVFIKKHIEGQTTFDLLPEFHKIIESITFGKNMRWGTQSIRYARPIRWLVGLFGSEIIPFEVAKVTSSNLTFGHRFLGDNITLEDPLNYESALLNQYVIVDPLKREEKILKGIHTLEKDKDIQIPVDKHLLDEVRNLVEFPQVFLGSFDQQFLKLPDEVLIISMKEHQRYFPVKSLDGKLLPYFVGIRNGNDYAIDTVIKGNEKVLRARLSDAAFFYEEDQKHSIEYYLAKLERVVFQEKLGTIANKVQRVTALTEQIGKFIHLNTDKMSLAIRAASICKFDLPTNMVNEFTELQGVIGEKYAHLYGENDLVAQAIREHYLPIQANGDLPATEVGAIVSIADKLDTITGCISVGLMPTGSQDPYGLRRQATGILRIVKTFKWDMQIENLLRIAQDVFKQSNVPLSNHDQSFVHLKEFFSLRAAFLLKEAAVEQDIIQAVLHDGVGIYDYTLAKAQTLSEKRNDDAFKPIQEALVRVLNLAEKAETTSVDPQLFETDSEKALYEQYQFVEESYQDTDRNAEKNLQLIAKLAEPIHLFFDNNMVMTDNERVRNNRLGLLANIANIINRYADLTQIEWKQHF